MATIANSNEITLDASSALNMGVSYGKYKAGMGIDYKESDYPVMPTEFISKKEVKEDKKSVAFIK